MSISNFYILNKYRMRLYWHVFLFIFMCVCVLHLNPEAEVTVLYCEKNDPESDHIIRG